LGEANQDTKAAVKEQYNAVEIARQPCDTSLTLEEMRAELQVVAEGVELMADGPERDQLEQRVSRLRMAIEARERPN
jgi:hypothetical protein